MSGDTDSIEWDPTKAAANRRKHGVAFEEAATVFLDPQAVTYDDPDHSVNEDRLLIVGHSTRERILVVSYMYRADRIRIISARSATPRERRKHEEDRQR
jgi:uncharacterized DUF497 family protein